MYAFDRFIKAEFATILPFQLTPGRVQINDILDIRRKVGYTLKNMLNVSVDVEISEPGSLPRFEGKAKRVIDRRVL